MIGNTPFICIDKKRNIYAKLETHNATGSVKDRMIKYICDRAVKSGHIEPGKTNLIEATSGNTGIALAAYAASINCPCSIVMPKNMSEQRKDMMRAFGAKIIETGNNEFARAIVIRERMCQEENTFSPMQFENHLNVECHYKTTAPEILSNVEGLTGESWTAFVHGAGTGGTMMGVKNFIDDNNLGVSCILTQPAEDNATHGIQGINDGADFLLDRERMDFFVSIKTEDAISRMKRFWKEHGILIGISSGANILASETYYEANPGGVIVTILCDRGERYL